MNIQIGLEQPVTIVHNNEVWRVQELWVEQHSFAITWVDAEHDFEGLRAQRALYGNSLSFDNLKLIAEAAHGQIIPMCQCGCIEDDHREREVRDYDDIMDRWAIATESWCAKCNKCNGWLESSVRFIPKKEIVK